MSYPVFLDIDASSPDPGQFPISIAWSLPDGQIKHILVCPDDDWEPWDNVDPDIDLQHAIDQGMSGLDIIREINMDLSGQTVFIDGLDDDEGMLDKLFESFNDEPDFELASLSQLMPGTPYEQILEKHQQIAEQEGLNTALAEENVRAMLFLSQSEA